MCIVVNGILCIQLRKFSKKVSSTQQKCKESISLFFHRTCCYHTLFKTQLMHCNLKYTLKTQSLLQNIRMSVSVVLPYMFRSLSLTILRGCSCCNATLRLVAFVTTVSGHVAVLSICVFHK